MKQTLKKTLVGLLFVASFILIPNLIATAFVAKDLPDTTNPCNSNTPRECEEISRPSGGGGTGGGTTIPSDPIPPTEPPMITSGSASGSVTVIVLPPAGEWNNDVVSYDKSCTIKLGESSCLAGFSWRINVKSWETFAVTTPNNFIVSKLPTAAIEGYPIEYPSRGFFFYKNGSLLHSINISASCDPATSAWSSTEKKCVKSPVVECTNGATNPPDCTIGQDGECINGAINPTLCNECRVGMSLNTIINKCEVTVKECTNGATNPPDCTTGEDGKCINGAINPSLCNECSAGMLWSATLKKCISKTSLDTTPRIALWAEHAHQHVKTGISVPSGADAKIEIWETDPDGLAFATSVNNNESYRVGLCRKYYGNSINSSPEYKTETITTWMTRWNKEGPSTSTQQTYKCSTEKKDPPVKIGSLTVSPSSCTINEGESTCTVTGATWSTSNVSSPKLEDGNMGESLSTIANNSTPLKVWVAYPQTVFNLKDGNTILDTEVVTSTCKAGLSWSSAENKCVKSPIIECDNGAINPPICKNECPAGTTWNATLNKCEGPVAKCDNGAINPPECTMGGDGKCLNGAINPPACKDECPTGTFWSDSQNKCTQDCKDSWCNKVLSHSARDCKIELGKNSCTSEIEWSTEYITGSFALVTPNHVTVSDKLFGKINYQIEYPYRDFFFYNNGEELVSGNFRVNATCKYGTEWNSGENKCVTSGEEGKGGGNGSGWDTLNEVCGECNGLTKICTVSCLGDLSDCPSSNGNRTMTYERQCTLNGRGSGELNPSIIINLKANPSRMLKGKTSVLSWETTGAKECEAKQEEGFGYFEVGVGNPTSGSASVKPDANTKYKIRCFDNNNYYNEATAEIKVYNLNIKEI